MDQIEQVRQKTDIVELITAYGVALKKAGRNFKGLCPFHEEKTPSFMVSPERQIFKCFGCQEGGDVFGFLMKKEGMEFGEALRELAQKAGVELKSFKPSKDQAIKEKLLEINHLASEYYHYLLMEHKLGKEGMQYLLKRGIKKDSMKTFKLGYAADDWEGLRNFLVKKKGYTDQQLEMAGLVVKGNRGFYDRFRNRIMFTLFDHRDRVVGFAGRVFTEEQKQAKYVNTPETVLYHKSSVLYGLEKTKEEIKKKNKAVVVEGELDAISSYQVNVKNVVAIKGSALTEEQVDLLKRFTDNLALALDQDTAGESAARRGIEMAERKGMNVRVIRVKYGKDPDECAQKSGRLWKESVSEAVAIYDFYIDSLVEKHGLKTPEGKRKVSDEMAKILARVDNEVVKDHYVKKLAQVLEVDEMAVKMEVEKQLRRGESGKVGPEVKREEEKSKQEVLEEYVLAVILQMDSEVKTLLKRVDLKVFSEAAVKKILKKLSEYVKSKKQFEVNKFVESLPAELVGMVDEVYLKDLGKIGRDPDKLLRELERTMMELKRILMKEKMEEISKKIGEAERAKEKQTLEALKKEFVKIAAELKS